MICDDCSANAVRLCPSLSISTRLTGNDCVGKIIHHTESHWAALFPGIIDKVPCELISMISMRISALQSRFSEGHVSDKERLHRAIAARISTGSLWAPL